MGSKLIKKGGIKPKKQATTSVRPKKSAVIEQEELKEEQEQDDEEQLGGFSSTDDSESESESESESDLESGSEEEQQEQEEQEQTNSKKKSKQESHEVKTLPKQNDKSSKKATKVSKGVVYIGRLPQGFEEKELKKYFNQFGDITNINFPRNKKTGKSKHYAFLEFSKLDDAKVAQETMNNYLILNHQLKVTIVDEEFKSSKKFKKSYFKVSKLTKSVKDLNKNVQDKRSKRAEALKAAGISF